MTATVNVTEDYEEMTEAELECVVHAWEGDCPDREPVEPLRTEIRSQIIDHPIYDLTDLSVVSGVPRGTIHDLMYTAERKNVTHEVASRLRKGMRMLAEDKNLSGWVDAASLRTAINKFRAEHDLTWGEFAGIVGYSRGSTRSLIHPKRKRVDRGTAVHVLRRMANLPTHITAHEKKYGRSEYWKNPRNA